jgi:hypothetical protein
MEAARKLVKKGIHPAQQKQLDRLKATLEQANTFEAIASGLPCDWEEITKKRRINMLERVVFRTSASCQPSRLRPSIFSTS